MKVHSTTEHILLKQHVNYTSSIKQNNFCIWSSPAQCASFHKIVRFWKKVHYLYEVFPTSIICSWRLPRNAHSHHIWYCQLHQTAQLIRQQQDAPLFTASSIKQVRFAMYINIRNRNKRACWITSSSNARPACRLPETLSRSSTALWMPLRSHRHSLF